MKTNTRLIPFGIAILLMTGLLAACSPVDLNAPLPSYDTGVAADAWASVAAGPYLAGQHNQPASIEYDYEIMVTDVTVAQYVRYLNEAVLAGDITLEDNQVVGYYPGDPFSGGKHEIEISAADYVFVPLDDPASRFTFDGEQFAASPGYENHPMTNVSWFGARGYCLYYQGRLPLESEWEKAARGAQDDRPFPWGESLVEGSANYYKSRDPFELMSSVGSRTTPVGFYNGSSYDGFQTLDAASPYGLYDMAGNVWQWTGDVHPGMHDRFLRGGSKDTYGMDLRLWVRNSAPPTYYSPGAGFRCVRDPQK